MSTRTTDHESLMVKQRHRSRMEVAAVMREQQAARLCWWRWVWAGSGTGESGGMCDDAVKGGGGAARVYNVKKS